MSGTISINLETFLAVFGTFIGIISIVISIVISYGKTKKMLEQIIARDFEGKLSKEQAMQTVELYILMIRRELTYHTKILLKGKADDFFKSNDKHGLQNALESIYRDSTSEVRNKFSSFKLIGNKKFDSILNHVETKPVIEAKKRISDILESFDIINLGDKEKLLSAVLAEIRKANDEGRRLMKNQIEEIYN